MKPEAIFFDAGGTLVLQHPHDMAALLDFVIDPDRAFEAHYRAMAEFSTLKANGNGASWEWWLERYFELLGHPAPATAGESIDKGRGLWRFALPGVREAVARIRESGVRVAVISNSDGSVGQSLVDAELAHLFETIVDSALVGVSKPDPQIFELACRKLDVDPSGCWYVGDSEYHDVAGAEGAGFAAAWLVDPLGLGSSERRINSVADLPTLV